MNRHLRAAAIAAGAAFLTVVPQAATQAQERPLIWQPTKNSDTSYSVRLGMKLPTRLEPEAGFNVGVDANKRGKIVETPLRFWTRIKTAEAKRPAYEMRRHIGISMDQTADTASISMKSYEKQIATPSINVERQADYVLRYDGTQGDWVGLDVTQSIKVRRPDTGTAFVAGASSTASFETIGANFGVEQKFGPNITLSGNVNRSFTDQTTVSSVNARYSYKW